MLCYASPTLEDRPRPSSFAGPSRVRRALHSLRTVGRRGDTLLGTALNVSSPKACLYMRTGHISRSQASTLGFVSVGAWTGDASSITCDVSRTLSLQEQHKHGPWKDSKPACQTNILLKGLYKIVVPGLVSPRDLTAPRPGIGSGLTRPQATLER